MKGPWYTMALNIAAIRNYLKAHCKTCHCSKINPVEKLQSLVVYFSNTEISQMIFLQFLSISHTGRERLIRSHSSARFCFELSENSN